jgi:peptidyl-prolyl cis-trans isomerase SurA
LPQRIRRVIAIAALSLTAVAVIPPAPAGAANSIRILVNDSPITSFDIQQRTKMIQTFSRGQQGEKAAIEQLIDEKLMLQEASRHRVEVSDAEVEAEFAGRARSAKLSAAQFQQAMRQAGFDPQTFRDFLRANMAWSQIVRARFRATVNITDQDVAAALTGRETTGEERTAAEYLIQPIIFVLPQNAGAGAVEQQRREAAAFRSAFQGCDQSLAQAGGKSGIVVKPQVRREEGQLSAALRTSLASMEIGGVTEPERVPEGIQILAICGKNAIQGQTEAELEAREEVSSEKGQLLARRYLRDLRSDAVIEYR